MSNLRIVCDMSSLIAIIGGGVSGALTAYHLARSEHRPRVIVFEPRVSLGVGLAYSTPSLRHLLNVPAGKISALPDRPDHFLDWLRAHHDPATTPATFVPRAVFGRYLEALMRTVNGIEHRREAVIDCRVIEGEVLITLENRQTLRADKMVLATGNFDPAPIPGVDPAAVARGSYFANPWDEHITARLDPAADVALIGNGLTAVDVVLRLREVGHTGRITAISRRGLRAHRHWTDQTTVDYRLPPDTPPTCRAYLRAVRKVIRGGAPWRAVIDGLRNTTNDLWLALPPREKARFRRHLQRRWDVARHRLAPAVADAIDADEARGSLIHRRGRIVRVANRPAGVEISLDSPTGRERLAFARVINCTGPAQDYRRVNSPLIQNLLARGLIQPGPANLGLACNEQGALIDAAGRSSAILFTIGPARLGRLIESIAVPELRQQTSDLAAFLLRARGGVRRLCTV